MHLYDLEHKADTHDNRRDSYRRPIRPDHRLNVSVQRGTARSLAGVIEDVSGGGAAIRIAGAPDSEWPEVGDQVTLIFHSTRARKQFEVQALAVAIRWAEPRERLYGFHFVDENALFTGLDPYMLRFFNRRSSVRCRPPLDMNVPAELHTSGARLVVTPNDISTTGMSVTCDREHISDVIGLRFARARLRLPGVREPIDFAGNVLYEAKVPNGLRLGLQFPDGGGVVGGLRKERAFNAFLRECEEKMALWNGDGS